MEQAPPLQQADSTQRMEISDQRAPTPTKSVAAAIPKLMPVRQPEDILRHPRRIPMQMRIPDVRIHHIHHVLRPAEEVPAPRRIVVNIRRIPRIVLRDRHGAEVIAITITKGGVARGGRKRRGLHDGGGTAALDAVALQVVGFGLEEVGEDVLRAGVVEVVVPPVLAAEADEPRGLGGLDEDAALGGDADADAGVVAGVVRHPRPEVVDVRGGARREVQADERAAAVGLAAAGELRRARAPHGDQAVVHGDVAGVVAREVDLEDDGAGELLADGEAHVLDVGGSLLVRETDLDNGRRVLFIGEGAARAGDGRPGLAVDFGARGDGDG